ncbi:hypothetical protein [Streptomyces sp. NPDC020298]|uniref:hypothetical protein n=1 Tax=unclassified Streptomyces TaxID=2593676 RepID=UPI0033C045DB
MPDVEPSPFCSYRPVAGERLAAACVECGHALAVHIGVEHCPVCELVHRNEQVRALVGDSRVHIEVTGLDERTLERTVQRVLERDRRRRAALTYLR